MALRVGVVGCRGIGTTHATSHKNDPLAELVAVCDVVRARADELAAKMEVKAYYSLSDMLANEELDMVDVCTGGPENGGWHFEPTMEALNAGNGAGGDSAKDIADEIRGIYVTLPDDKKTKIDADIEKNGDDAAAMSRTLNRVRATITKETKNV